MFLPLQPTKLRFYARKISLLVIKLPRHPEICPNFGDGKPSTNIYNASSREILESQTVFTTETRLGIARKRERQQDWEVVIAHGSVEFCEATPNDLVEEPKKSCIHGRDKDRDLRSA